MHVGGEELFLVVAFAATLWGWGGGDWGKKGGGSSRVRWFEG